MVDKDHTQLLLKFGWHWLAFVVSTGNESNKSMMSLQLSKDTNITHY